MSSPEAEPGTVPLRVPITDGEALDSWIEALARRHDVAPRTMALGLGITGRSLGLRQLVHLSPCAERRRIEYAAGLPPGRLDRAVPDPATAVRLGSGGSRYCPRCLGETDGRWPVRWRSSWSIACAHHRLLLHDTCPACGTAPRRNLPGGPDAVTAASCTHLVASRTRCGTDLSVAATTPAPHEVLDTQDWIDHLVDPHARRRRPENAATLRDLPVVIWWLLRHDHEAITAAADRLRPGRPDTVTPARLWSHGDAAATAAVLARAQVILAGSDHEAITALREIVARWPTRALPPTDMSHACWRAMQSAFPSRFLRALDPDLPTVKRLRHKSVLPSAERPASAKRRGSAEPAGHGSDRAAMLPQLLWPDWTARLLPPTGHGAERLRTILSTSLLLPGRPDGDLGERGGELNPRVRRRDIAVLLQSFATPPHPSLDDVLTLLCRLSEHLDQVSSPIDYQRRRERIPVETITREHWRELACSIGEHPGDQPREGRYLHVRRHLHELLCGSNLDDPRHPLGFRRAADRARYHDFTARLTTRLRHALFEHARHLLGDLGIDEPVTWSPPAHLADGLDLPGVDLDQLDLQALQRHTVDQPRPLSEVASTLGVHIEHVRLALERLDLPQRQWAQSTPPSAWRRKQRATRTLTPEVLEREYLHRQRSLLEIARCAGLDRDLVVRLAKEAGITPAHGPRPHRIDPTWLREQYRDQQRSTSDIATELGLTQMTVSRALQRHAIPRREPGVASFPEMLAVPDQHLSVDLRAAVTGNLRGWHRLHRFHIAMRFPSLLTAATYLGAAPAALITQFRRLERDIDTSLFHRSTFRHPQQPTERGRAVLADLDTDHAQQLLQSHLRPDQLRAMPGPDDLAEAHRQFARPPHKPTPPQRHAVAEVRPLRLTQPFFTLLRDLDQNPGEFYGHDVIRRSGIDPGTLYPMLQRMRHGGWLTTRTETEQQRHNRAARGPARTYYALTDAGRRAGAYDLTHHEAAHRS